MFFVNSIDGALEAAEESLSTKKSRGEIDSVGKFVDCCFKRSAWSPQSRKNFTERDGTYHISVPRRNA